MSLHVEKDFEALMWALEGKSDHIPIYRDALARCKNDRLRLPSAAERRVPQVTGSNETPEDRSWLAWEEARRRTDIAFLASPLAQEERRTIAARKKKASRDAFFASKRALYDSDSDPGAAHPPRTQSSRQSRWRRRPPPPSTADLRKTPAAPRRFTYAVIPGDTPEDLVRDAAFSHWDSP